MRLIVALLTLALTGVSCAAQVVVEQAASDIPAVLQAVKKAAAAEPAAAFQAAAMTGIDVQWDCKKFIFEESSPAESAPQDFRSETWLEECDNIPMPNPPGGGICIPRRRLLSVDQRTVKISITGRQAPGPKEVFEVCLWGRSLSLKVKQSPNKYSVQEKNEPVFNTTYVLTKK
ncbi:MAG: hypothetical protein HY922_02760 [Elusimicrobia bacterium]|nr:hypothetical protein [Elusimicrobiota bacterium]